MNLGTVYLIVNDFEEYVEFMKRLLGMPVSSRNMDRFAQFNGKNISIMNGHLMPSIRIRLCVKADMMSCLMISEVKRSLKIPINLF